MLFMMTDHEAEDRSPGPGEPMLPGFAHDQFVQLLGVNIVKATSLLVTLLEGGCALAEEFQTPWHAVQEAAGAGAGPKEPGKLLDPDGKRHEQHQLTELVENILGVDVRRAFVGRTQGDLTRMAVLDTIM